MADRRKGTSSTQLKRAGLFKGLLFIGAMLMTAALFFSTYYIIREIRDDSRNHLNLSVKYYRSLLLGDNPELAYEAVKDIDFPIILSDKEGNPKFWKNIPIDPVTQSPESIKQLKTMIAEMDAQGHEPVEIEIVPGIVDYFHYGDPGIVSLLRYFSVVTVIAVALYIGLGYVGFKTIRKAEERNVWIGMARETAHQLGTPISSLMGWLEVLGDKGGETTAKMKQDVSRLERIAIRFSKIGSNFEKPEHKSLHDVVTESVTYMKSRVGSGVSIEIICETPVVVPMQPELIGWVLENVIRNAAQAEEGKGKILLTCAADDQFAYIDVQDFGKGIAARDHDTIFRPGYTTKRRGWGLGLSLARRIMVEMHRGKLFVKESKPGEGTTIRMVLPL